MDVSNNSLWENKVVLCGVATLVLVARSWMKSLYRRAITPRSLCWPCFSMPELLLITESAAHSHLGPILMQEMFKRRRKRHEQPASDTPVLDQKSIPRKSVSFYLLSELQLKSQATY